jgi:hypothetical protein
MAARRLRQRPQRPHVPPTPTQLSPQTGQTPGRAATPRPGDPSRPPANVRGTRLDLDRSVIRASPPSGLAPNRPTGISLPAQPSLAAPTDPAPINRHPRGTFGLARRARRQLRIAGDSLPRILHLGRLATIGTVSLLPLRIVPEARHRINNDHLVRAGAIHAVTNDPVRAARTLPRTEGEGCQARLRLRQ